jgi:DNA-binding transcriptional LysR family regulator
MRHLTQLRYIDVVAREGSIRKAAEKLSITSTALNRRILALEDEIGTPLFERLPGGVRLNTAGELFIQHVRLQITDLSRVLSHIADLSGIRRGNVRIGAGPEIVGAFLPTQVSDYRKQHSAVTFEIVRMGSEETLASLRSLDIDIGIIFDSVLPSDVQIVATAIQQLNVIMSATHPLAEKKQLRCKIAPPTPLFYRAQQAASGH